MADADVKRKVDDAIETLEALYFFLHAGDQG